MINESNVTEKYALKKALLENNDKKINQLIQELGLEKEQLKYIQKGLTGFPSIDQIWKRNYEASSIKETSSEPEHKTVWDYLEPKLDLFSKIPAIEYFGKQTSRNEFKENVYKWAKAFKAMGIQEDEIVPYYGPFLPDIAEITLALNLIGATPYFLKLAISPEALTEETKEAKIAIVFDEMWPNVRNEFEKDKFKNIIMISASDRMPILQEKLLSLANSVKNRKIFPKGEKFLKSKQAKNLSKYYSGPIKAKYKPNRSAFITSSSGTTIGGIVKGTVATNEAVISQIKAGELSEVQYFEGDRCLLNFPPTAATSLNALYLLALAMGLTLVIDPRVKEEDFYNQLIKLKPNAAATTGSLWEAFFNRLEKEIAQGKSFDLSYVKGWVMGGEGTDLDKYKKWNKILKDNKAVNGLFNGYGLSETFSTISLQKKETNKDTYKEKGIVDAGIPYVGVTVGVFDENGNELTYNQRGELWAKSNTVMKGYYNKPELTDETVVDGWVHTGDLAEINENGEVFVWGRANDSIDFNGKKIYLFDVANIIKENDFIEDALVLDIPTIDGLALVAHVVFKNELDSSSLKNTLTQINNSLKTILLDGLPLLGFYEHKEMLPYSPTTLKKDKNGMSKLLDGYKQVIDNELQSVSLKPERDKFLIVTEKLNQNIEE